MKRTLYGRGRQTAGDLRKLAVRYFQGIAVGDFFISAVSLQEIIGLLTGAVIIVKRDGLGPKENVMVGLLPSSTGLAFHRDRKEKEVWERKRLSTAAAAGEGKYDC